MENSEKFEFLPLESAQNTDPGRKRPNNEDWVTGFEPTNPLEIQSSGSLYIVADGVGGASRGERASQYAAERVLFDFFKESTLEPAIRLQNAMRSVCGEIFEYAQDNNLSRMATTMVAANIRGNILTVANVGDSRCYLIRSGKVVQITQDHNIAAELVRNGSMTVEEAKHAKSGNTLLRSIGGDPDVDVDIFGEIDLFPGDMLVLCSDGLTRYLESETLLGLCADGTAEQISKRLVDFANNSGGADNVSIYVIKVGSDAISREIDEEKTIPTPITLDSTKTKKSVWGKKTTLSFKKSLNRGKIVNIGLLGILVIVLFFGVYYLTSREKDQSDNLKSVLSTTPIPELPVAPLADPTIPTQEAIPANVTNDPLIVPTEPTVTANVTQSIIEAPTATLTPQVTPTSNPTFNCVYVTQSRDNISTIFDEFGLIYTKYEQFSRFKDCNLGQLSCSDARETKNITATLQLGWFLIIPEVDEETCRLGDDRYTYWISVKP